MAVDGTGDVPVVELSGEWDLDNAATLRTALAELAADGAERVVIDLSATAFLDSTAIQALVAVVQKRVAVTVRGARGTVLRTLMMAGMDAIVDIEE
jgi:anti-anti-sigma factor